ncbi:MAG TPA: hypothetical protein VHM91_02320, partial [Verrucomicrobiales bacterium]|nr:hypothetical protein [Verrucomicrobiales bacterium]
MADAVAKDREAVETAQLDFACEKLIVSENNPAKDGSVAERAMDWQRWYNAVDRERTVIRQCADMAQQRWAKQQDRARASADQYNLWLIDIEIRRARAAELAGIASTFRSAHEDELKLLEGKPDPAKQGASLEALAHGIALLTADRDGAADTLKRARAALLKAAPDNERARLAKSYEDGPWPAWWPATPQAPRRLAKTGDGEPDPYWKWYPGFVKLLREKYAVVAAASRKTGLMSLGAAQARARRFRMEAALEGSKESGLYSQVVQDRVKASIAHDRESETSFYAPEFARFEKEAVDAMDVLMEELGKATLQWGKDHPELLRWQTNTSELRRRIPLQLAEAAMDDSRIATLLRESETWQDVPPYTATWRELLQSKLNLMRGDTLGALFILRDLFRQNPADADLRRRLTEVEASMIKAGLSKVGGAIAQARANFNQYLSERGLGKGEKDNSWLSKQLGGLRDYDSETAWMIWSTGIISWIPQALDRAGDEDRKLEKKEAPLNNAYLGMQVMARLCVRGHTLAEIRKMEPEAILEMLPKRTTKGKPWDLKDAGAFRNQIDAALALPDVKMLVDDERDGLAQALQEAYWDPKDASTTWFEWVGDLSSPRHLLTFWAPLVRFEVAGEVLTGTQLLNRRLGVEAAVKWAGTTSAGEKVATVLLASSKYREGSLAWGGAVFVAKSGWQSAVSCLGKQFAGQYGQIAADSLFAIAAEPGKLSEWMTEGKVAREAMEEVLAAARTEATTRMPVLQEIETASDEVIQVLQQLEKNPGMTLDPAVDAKLKALLGAEWMKEGTEIMPSGGANDVIRALVAGVKAARERAKKTGVSEALEVLKDTVDAEKDACSKTIAATNALQSQLAGTSPPPEEALECFLPKAVESWKALVFGNKSPWTVKPGTPTAQAFGFLHGGKADEAGKAFRALAAEAEAELAGRSPLPAPVLKWLAELSDDLQKLPKRVVPEGLQDDIIRPIENATLDALIKDAQNATWKTRPVSEITFLNVGGESFAVKRLAESKQGLSTMIGAAEGEMLNFGVSAGMSINVPAVGIRPQLDAAGKLELYIVTRLVKGKEVSELSAAEIFQLHEEISLHRGVALALGDFDRKVSNYMLTANGALCAMDGGSADVQGRMAKRMFGVGVDHPEMMEGVWGIGHWLRRCRYSFDKHGADMPADMKADLLNELAATSGPALRSVASV